ncbi:MAG: metalloregulator ArsR/SmtB family transcription factor [Dehalogenimonas sp.]
MRALKKICKAIADETRLRILNLIAERDCCVCEVEQVLGISQTRASRNLSQLLEAGFLGQRREGLWNIYFLDPTIDSDYRGLIVAAVKKALANDVQGNEDLKRLKASTRMSPTAELSKS